MIRDNLLEELREDFNKNGVLNLQVNDIAYLFQTINKLDKRVESVRNQRFEKHFGPYGPVCAGSGQFDAGFCWKCQIEMLKEEVRILKESV